ncbi:NAD-dependent epimerase/dehydratase family protein [Microbacterium imperiale]|uniref:Nucleoside-diphosphate-sugar epimerase n=1 Tax=Microbacterium imperiale TaxID=33884 RepID=A0A9W6HHL7_9MICO|nr:NAD(P)-dependent oxidoreductase [Microbacterium imperiale]MBP2421473.1 nucleoside-diphosphate-sugar epimerase [Microbacterium imperiale]MDS0199420.1 NAD(P)-dependent oxidoreductase [Microbacterium imperiale]BFE41812.1 NAD(P)-dependent oxidoreductase [Microbacterium imperiale]GLJ80764.1 nucleoside-diphosphate-sugar epimerase [Microbacterium imperiale]
MSRIVVTGGGGRLGRSLVAGLVSAGHRVVSFDRTVSDVDDLRGADQVAIDLLDAEATTAALRAHRADAVIHLAAIAVPFSAPEDVIMRTNSALAVSVLGGAVAAGIPRVVAASSPTVLGYGAPHGWVPERFPLDEDTLPRPWNAYALSKLVVEQTMHMLRRQSGDGIRLAAFRPCYVIAPEEWAGAPTQQGNTVRQRLDDPALAAPALFNYVDARDVASFVEALLSALPGIPNAETFFVGADDALARRPLAELIPRFHPGTADVAAVLTGTTPAFSNAKARRLLDWAPQRSWRTELRDDAPTAQRKDVPA